MIGAGLFLRSLGNAQWINPGFETEKLLALSFDPGAQGYDKARGMEHYRRVVERVEALPGVISAAIASARPFNLGVLHILLDLGDQLRALLPEQCEEFFQNISRSVISQ
jgi:hypothetical protein